jgi:hypothetical protein
MSNPSESEKGVPKPNARRVRARDAIAAEAYEKYSAEFPS